MTAKSGLQSRKHRETLFAQGGQIAANATESLSPGQAAETARNLLLDLDHAQVTFGEIVVKIHAQIFHKAEDGCLVFVQAIEQISGGTLFASALFSSRSSGSGSEHLGLGEHAKKRGFPISHFQGMQPTSSLRTRLFGGGFHVQEQGFEIGSPPRVVFFCQKHQIAQEMHQAESMPAAVQEVRPPSIMDADPLKLWQNPVVTLFRSGVEGSRQESDPGPGMIGETQCHCWSPVLIPFQLCVHEET
jgi:hypothetical protein